MTAYTALLRKELRSDYGVDFPDFRGCVTVGRSMEEARRVAAEALAFHVEGMRQDGVPIPPPSSKEVIMADRYNRSAVAILVDLRTRSGLTR